MTWIFAAMAVWSLLGLAPLAARSARRAGDFGIAVTLLGAALAAVPVVLTLAGRPPAAFSHPWAVPYGSLAFALDGLSAFFMVPLLLLTSLGAIFGWKYWQHEDGPIGPTWLFYNLLIASMVAVLCARNGVLFLVAWETMALVSFFLVTSHAGDVEVRKAGWIYLIATHLGSVFLLPMFVTLGQAGTSLDFDHLAAPGTLAPATAAIVFVLAVLGFGSKAGFLPMHVWLPEAHPAAPSPVSAVMSGVMIKLGIYGILRVLLLLGAPAAWWGWLLVGIGLASGVFGVLMALAQHDLKRLLAYSSVENIGIIAMGIGVGIIGLASGQTLVAILGFAGALWHVVNHALFKGLLFLGAGAIQHATGTRQLDRLGGLLKTMPRTGVAVLVGSAAISGLPPLNGFASEFAIFLGALVGATTPSRSGLAGLLVVAAGLALIGGLATACFAKAFGVVFLGVPRSDAVEGAHDPGAAMLWPLGILAGTCALLGLGAPLLLPALLPAISLLTGLPAAMASAQLHFLWRSLIAVEATILILAILFFALYAVRSRWLAARPVSRAVTWDCGFGGATARMQYSSAAFAMPLISAFSAVVASHGEVTGLSALFPREGSWSGHSGDIFKAALSRGFGALQRILRRFRRLQNGNLQVYVLYIALTMLVLLVWKLGI